MVDKEIPKKMPLKADEDLEAHLREPFYVISYSDDTEARFNIGDVVSLHIDKDYYTDDDNQKESVDKTFNVELISGLSFVVDKETYEEIMKLKHWDDTKDNTRYVNKKFDN